MSDGYVCACAAPAAAQQATHVHHVPGFVSPLHAVKAWSAVCTGRCGGSRMSEGGGSGVVKPNTFWASVSLWPSGGGGGDADGRVGHAWPAPCMGPPPPRTAQTQWGGGDWILGGGGSGPPPPQLWAGQVGRCTDCFSRNPFSISRGGPNFLRGKPLGSSQVSRWRDEQAVVVISSSSLSVRPRQAAPRGQGGK